MSFNRIYDAEIEATARLFPSLDVADAVASRKVLTDMAEAVAASGVERPTDPNIEEIEKTILGPDGNDLAIRIYMPKNRTEAGPGFVNFHGGGFILGDLDSEHTRCLAMSGAGGAVSITVDYRLAPEHPFPAGVEDCYTTLQWVVDNAEELKIDANKIAVGGGSAGGNLSAAVALMARDRKGPKIAFQMLIYPVIDNECNTPSMQTGKGLYIWDTQNAIDMWNHYIGTDHSAVSPYAAPARAKDLSGLPPAYVMTAEHDPLRDEGILYAMRLMAAGVRVELHNFPGTVHGFDFLAPSALSQKAVAEGIEAFKQAMES